MADGLIAQPSSIDGLEIGSPFADSLLKGVPQKPVNMPINPQSPIASLCAGNQQFTIARDNYHGSPLIPAAVAQDMKSCADEGVKHLIIEYGTQDRAEIDAQFPELKGLSTQESLNKVRAMMESNAASEDLSYAEWQLRNLDVEERLSMNPPQITMEELLENADLFETASAETEAEAKLTGIAYATMLGQAAEAGIQVHFAGDYPGMEHFLNANHYLSEYNNTTQARENYIIENSDLHSQYLDYLEQNDPTLISNELFAEFNAHFANLQSYDDQMNATYTKWEEANASWYQARFGDEALEARVDRFIEMADGERTIVLWGGGHFDNESNPTADIDEYLDTKIWQKALQDGTYPDFETTKQIGLYPSQAQLMNTIMPGTEQPDAPDLIYTIEDQTVQISPEFEGQYMLQTPPKGAEPNTAFDPFAPK